MPFIDETQLAALYKEVDQEKKATAFFQDLHQKNKAKMVRYTIYRLGFFSAVALLFLCGIYFMGNEKSDADSKSQKRMEQPEFENSLLGGSAKDMQNTLRSVTVFTIQFMANNNRDTLLFSDNFVNFKVHPLKEFNAFSLGNFSTEAEAFRKELFKLGLKDLWVTSYKFGERILFNN